MADKGGLQLLPETRKKIDIKVPGQNRLIYIGVVLIAIVLIAYGGLAWYSSSLSGKISDADAQLVALEKQRDKKGEQKLLTLSKQVGITNQIVNNHIYWSAGLTHIEMALQNKIQFKSFAGVLGEDSFHIRALSDNYTTIAKQLAAFVADDSITDVTLDGVSTLTNGQLDFNTKVSFDPAKFLKNK